MGLWAGATINANDSAFLFNTLASRKSFDMVRKKQGLLYALLGEKETGSTPGTEGFQRLARQNFNKVEQRLLGALESPATVADANQIDAVTPAWDNDAWGAAEWSLAHYAHPFYSPASELDRFMGNDAKTADFIDEWFNKMMLSYRKVWSTALNLTGASAQPSRTVLGSVPYAIEGVDGAWTDASDDYGGLARDDSGNADFRGNVQASVGTLSLDKIRTTLLDVEADGGNVKVASAGSTVIGIMHKLLEPYTVVTYDESWTKFGGDWVQFAGVKYIHDPDCASGYMLLLDPETWRLYINDSVPMTRSGIVNDITLKAMNVVQTQWWMQCICLAPSHNGLLKGITG
jgi:hypothetical protein